MKEYSNPYTYQIFSELVPLIGSIVAKSVLKNVASKVGKTEETLSVADSTKISEVLEKGLSVFLGSDVAKQVAQKIGQIK